MFVWQGCVEACVGATPLRFGGDQERLLASTMASYWLNFVRSQDPNGLNSTSMTIPWPAFAAGGGEMEGTSVRGASLHFQLPALSVDTGVFDEQCDFVDSLGVLPSNPVAIDS